MNWLHYYRLPDGNVRPWFFEYKNELYLLNTIEERRRRYTNISKIRTWDVPQRFFANFNPAEVVATIKDCGFYFATATYGDDIYYVATHETESFGKLCLHFFDDDEVNEKLLSMFE